MLLSMNAKYDQAITQRHIYAEDVSMWFGEFWRYFILINTFSHTF